MESGHVLSPSSNKITSDSLVSGSTSASASATQPLPPQPDGSAPPSLASAPDTKSPRELKEKLRESLSTSAAGMSLGSGGGGGGGGGGEKDLRARKASEPPPSLQALFSRDNVGSSRRWGGGANRQISADEIHMKQHSFDSSHLQQSPKLYARRVKSPSVSDKNSRANETPLGVENIHRTPSHPHLNSAISSPQVSRSPSSAAAQQQQQQQQQQQRDRGEGNAQPAIVHARSTQHLTSSKDEKAQQNWIVKTSSGGSNTDLATQHRDREALPPSGLKLMKDRELSMSKESLTGGSKESSGGGGMKRTASRESLKGGGTGGGGGKEGSKVIQAPPKEGNIVSGSSGGGGGGGVGGSGSVGMAGTTGSVSIRELNKENRERSAPSKDTQSSAEGSVENMQAPLFQQVRRIYNPPSIPYVPSFSEFNCRVLPPSQPLN